VDPSGDYREALWSDPNQRGFAFQACLVDEPRLGRFDECEHHSPAAVADGPEVCDRSAVLTWSGTAEALTPLVDLLFPSPCPWKGPPCAAAPAT